MKKLLVIAGIILLVFGFKLGNDYLESENNGILMSFDEPGQNPPITRASFDEPGQNPPITRAITNMSFDEPGQNPPITRA